MERRAGSEPSGAPGTRAIAHLLFDLDGTLIDSYPGIAAAVEGALALVLPGVPHCFGAHLIGPPIREIFRASVPGADERVLGELAAAYRHHYDDVMCLRSTAYPGVLEGLARAEASGIACYVVTNKPTRATTNVLEGLGLAPYLRAAWSPDTREPRFASKAAMVTALLAEFGVDPSFTALVGDSPEDREAATANGLRFVGVTYGYGRIEAPDVPLLATFADLWTVLEAAPS